MSLSSSSREKVKDVDVLRWYSWNSCENSYVNLYHSEIEDVIIKVFVDEETTL